MVVFNFKLTRKKKRIAAILIAIFFIGIISAFGAVSGGSTATADEAAEPAKARQICESFMTERGLSFGKCGDERQVVIPAEFNEVYENYNSLQERSGFDLSRFKGKTAEKLVYPLKDGQYATLLVRGTEVIGGHISAGDYGGEDLPLKGREDGTLG